MKRLALFGALAALGCGHVDTAAGHSEAASLVKERTGVPSHWENGAPEDDEVRSLVGKLLAAGLTRERAVEIALLNNRKLQATYEGLGVSQAEMVQAGLLKNPTFSGSVGFPIRGASIWESEFALAQDFLDLFVLPLRKHVAAEQFSADVARVANEALSVAAETSQAIAEVQAAEKRVQLFTTLKDNAEAARQLAAAQSRAGNINDLQLASERAATAQAELDLEREELQLGEARERVNRLLGLFGQETNWKLAAELSPVPETDALPEHLEARAMQNRLDVAAAFRTAQLMREAVDVAKRYRAAGFVEIGIHSHQDPDGPRLAGPTLSLELPLFDQRTAYIARLEAESRRADKELEALSVDVRSEVRLAAGRLHSAHSVARHYQRVLVPLREQVLSESQRQYNGMQIGLYQLLAAKRDEVDAYKGYLDALRDYWVARAELERAIGGALVAPGESK